MSNIQAGYYAARAIAGSEQYGLTPNGDEQIVLEVEVPALGRTLSTFLYFTDAAAPYALERLRACGWAGNDVRNLVGLDANEIQVQVRYEVYQGKERMKVEIATGGGGGKITLDKPLDDGRKAAFAARMKALIASSPPAGGGTPAAPRAAGQPAARTGGGFRAPTPAATPEAEADPIPF